MSFSRPALILTILLSLGTSCATPPEALPSEESQYFYTIDKGFHISAREGVIRYRVTLEKISSGSGPLYLTVDYENPAAPDAPFTEENTWVAEENILRLVSPPLHGLEAGKRYRVTVTLFENPQRAEAEETQEIFIFSNINTRRYER